MAVRRRAIFGALLLAFAVFASGGPPVIRFAGVLTDAGDTRLYLTADEVGTGGWLHVGETFSGFKLAAYDPAEETATLRNSETALRLHLIEARIRNGVGELAPQQIAAIRENLRLLLTAARLHFLEGKGHYATFADLVGPEKYLARLEPIAGEDYRGLTLMKGETDRLVVMTAAGDKVVFGGTSDFPTHDP